jgi:hypothetical protein
MDWKSRLPNGVNGLEVTADGFTAGVTIPPDGDGYIGRRCPGCTGRFRMLSDEYVALPDETQLTCPYCGREDDAGEFMTEAQLNRARAAGEAVAEQWMHEEFGNMLGRALGGQRPSSGGGMFSIRVEHKPSTSANGPRLDRDLMIAREESSSSMDARSAPRVSCASTWP